MPTSCQRAWLSWRVDRRSSSARPGSVAILSGAQGVDQTINQAQERTRRKAEHAARRSRIEQLQQKIREQAAARDWDAVVAASDELAGLDLATTDPDGLASTARKQIADRQQAEEAERAAARAQHLADDPFARPDELPLGIRGCVGNDPSLAPLIPRSSRPPCDI